jgi:molecular chaperone GrpE (heat shock protein)
MHIQDELLQFTGRLLNLAHQIENMQWEVARLSRETQASNSKVNVLTQYLINSESHKQINEHLAEVLSQIETSQENLEDLSQTVKKLSRTQFKANALSESKEQQVSETLAFLRDLTTRREELKEAQKSEEEQRISELQARARGELAADFLPVLDGIEMALEHKTLLPEKPATHPEQAAQDENKGSPSAGFFRKLFGSSSHTLEQALRKEELKVHRQAHETLQGWLHGLEIVRERFLRLLEREGIERIPDLAEQFDPHLHVAVETEERTDVADNTIVAVLRKGYRHKERVLRYSEVIVAKSPEEEKG